MSVMRFACVQICTSADVAANNIAIKDGVVQAVGGGARFIALPEATNILLRDNALYPSTCRREDADITLALCRDLAARHGVWLHTGSLLLKQEQGERVWNRSHLISPRGDIVARYDKLHTFDVQLGGDGDFCESKAVAPGERAVVAQLGDFGVGMAICYDVRFAYLLHALAQAGANVLMVPASFSVVTGPLHWETLLKARAIETGSYVVAAAQCGERDGVATFGQSRVISPFGEVLAAAGDEPAVIFADLDSALVAETRRRLPVLTQVRTIGVPERIELEP